MRVVDGSKSSIISIHALLAESDVEKVPADVFYAAFLSTLSLRRATLAARWALLTLIFLSTLSLRRATGYTVNFHAKPGFLSTLSLRRATINSRADNLKRHISIHALLAESDTEEVSGDTWQRAFLSTLSLRRATAKVHKTVGHFCAYETNFMEIASSC